MRTFGVFVLVAVLCSFAAEGGSGRERGREVRVLLEQDGAICLFMKARGTASLTSPRADAIIPRRCTGWTGFWSRWAI